jgi:hypothetical protein
MCPVLLPPGVNPIAVNRYIDINISRQYFFACVPTLSCYISTATVCQPSTQRLFRARDLTCKFSMGSVIFFIKTSYILNFGYKVVVDEKKRGPYMMC